MQSQWPNRGALDNGAFASGTLATRAASVLARGVSSAARLRSEPLILTGAYGAYVEDTDGNQFADYVLGMGPMLLGHGNQRVLEAVRAQIDRGVLFGTHPNEIALAERLTQIFPFADKVLFVNSGSEATHSAVRIARATTKRSLVVKFEGHYHGWLDPLFINTMANEPAGPLQVHPAVVSAASSIPIPDNICVCRWNDIGELTSLFEERSEQIAAVIMEPLPLNFGTMFPDPGYLEAVRDLCTENGTLLIFDEVLAGFRVSLGGASELLRVEPDIAVYAKAIASGFPLAFVAGSNAAMLSITSGPLMPAGTYSGSPTAISAAHATLDILELGGGPLYQELDKLGRRVAQGVTRIAEEDGVPLVANQIGSIVQLFWDPETPVRTFADGMKSDRAAVAAISEGLLEHGSLVSPRGLILLSTLHTVEMIDDLIDGLEASTRKWVTENSGGRGSARE